MTVAMGLGVVGLWRTLVAQQRATIDKVVQAETDGAANEVSRWFTTHEQAVLRMARRVEQNRYHTAEDWTTDASAYLASFGAIQNLSVIDSQGRPQWTKARKPDTPQMSDLTRLRQKLTEQGRIDDAPQAIHCMLPLDDEPGSNPSPHDHHELLTWVPLIRDNQYIGAVEVVLNVNTLVDQAMHNELGVGYLAQLTDHKHVIWPTHNDDRVADQHVHQTSIKQPPLPWTVRMWPSENLTAHLEGPYGRAVLAPGLLAAAMVGMAMWLATVARRRARRLDQLNDRLEHDLAERRRITEDQARLVAILEATSDFVATGDADGSLTYLNSAGRRMVGLGLDHDIHDVRWKDLCPSWAQELMGRTAIPQAIERGVWSGESALINPLGYELPVSQVIIAHTDDAGRFKYLSTIIRDISDRKLTEEVLRESRQTLISRLTAIEAAHDMIVITDTDGVIDYVNPAFTRTTGYTAREALGQKTSILKSGRHDEEFYESMWNTLTAGRPWRGTMINRRKDGSLYPEEQTITPVKNAEGKTVRFVAIKRDITRRRQVEQADRERKALQQAVTAMEQVLGVVGHELRTPLAALRATSEFLMTDTSDLSAQSRTFLKTIHDQTIAMSEMVNNLLEAARLNSGCARWNWEDVPLDDACESAISMVENLVDTERVTLDYDVSPHDLRMSGDAEAIRRLIINLLTNAAKHTRDGSIHIAINHRLDGDRAWVQLRVSDTGEGIDEQVVHKLGQAFVLNSGVVGSDYVKGTGLGLAICRGIVAAHGGSISVDSAPGEGTTFSVLMRADLTGPCETSTQQCIRKETAA